MQKMEVAASNDEPSLSIPCRILLFHGLNHSASSTQGKLLARIQSATKYIKVCNASLFPRYSESVLSVRQVHRSVESERKVGLTSSNNKLLASSASKQLLKHVSIGLSWVTKSTC